MGVGGTLLVFDEESFLSKEEVEEEGDGGG
jgi:hypothetical protein